MPKTTRVCAGFPGEPCDRPVMARGWCSTHYYRYMRRLKRGLTHEEALQPRSSVCRGVPGEDCDRPVLAQGWCDTHYYRYMGRIQSGWTHEAALTTPVRSRRHPSAPRVCEVPSCTRAYETAGLCAFHRLRKRNWGTTDDRYLPCPLCGEPVLQGAGGPRACKGTCAEIVANERSNAWGKTDVGRRSHSLARMRRRGVYAEPYLRTNIFDRDGWTCRLCGDPIDRTIEWPDPFFASIDHILPLSKGGLDVDTNVQAAHLTCNVRKGNREDAFHAVLIA